MNHKGGNVAVFLVKSEFEARVGILLLSGCTGMVLQRRIFNTESLEELAANAIHKRVSLWGFYMGTNPDSELVSFAWKRLHRAESGDYQVLSVSRRSNGSLAFIRVVSYVHITIMVVVIAALGLRI